MGGGEGKGRGVKENVELNKKKFKKIEVWVKVSRANDLFQEITRSRESLVLAPPSPTQSFHNVIVKKHLLVLHVSSMLKKTEKPKPPSCWHHLPIGWEIPFPRGTGPCFSNSIPWPDGAAEDVGKESILGKQVGILMWWERKREREAEGGECLGPWLMGTGLFQVSNK